VSKQMTWAELEAWAKRNGFSVQVYPAGPSEHGEVAARLLVEPGVSVLDSDGDDEDIAKRALCRAVSAIREAK